MKFDQTFDIESYLNAKGVGNIRRNQTHLYTQCFFCGENDKGSLQSGRLYINNTYTEKHGVFDCKLCGVSGGFWRILQYFGDNDEYEPKASNSTSSFAIIRRAAMICRDNLRDVDIEYLRGRGLTDETITRRGLGHTLGGRWLYVQMKDEFSDQELVDSGLFFRGEDEEVRDRFTGSGITIPYFAGKQVVSLRWRNLEGTKPKYLGPTGADLRLYNTNTVWGANEVVITEGEFDAMIMEQLGFHAVSVPGAASWSVAWNGYFDDAERVWILTDPDTEGTKGADRIEDSIGKKSRIAPIPIPDGVEAKKVDPSWLVAREGWTYNNFRHMFDVLERKNSLLITPMEAYDAWVEDQAVGGLLTGWEMFDVSIGKGIRRSDLVIPIARTNVGKTNFLINLINNILTVPGQEDLRILLFTLEQTRAQWLDRQYKVWGFNNPGLDPKDVPAAAAEYFESRMRLVDKNLLSEKEVRETLEHYRADMGDYPDLVALDYIGYFSRGFPGGQTIDRVSAAAQALKNIAKDINRPFVSPSQASRKAEHGREVGLDDARDSGEIENTADLAIGLWSEDTMKGREAENRTGEVDAKFIKTRGPGRGKKVKFIFAPISLAWVPLEDVHNRQRATLEIGWDNAGDVQWSDAYMAHSTGRPPHGRKIA